MSNYTKVTIKKEVAEQGKIQAAAQNRSLSNYVEWLIHNAPPEGTLGWQKLRSINNDH